MTSRERVQATLNHVEPDRVPLDLGGSVVTSIALSTYAALRGELGLPATEIRTMEVVQQIAEVDEDVIDALALDVVPVFANAPSGYEPVFVENPDGSSSFRDEFGATLRKPVTSYYYDWREFPLPEPSIQALEEMAWPDPADPARYRGLRERVRAQRSATDKALFGMAPCGHDLFNQLFRVRGMEDGLIDLISNTDFAEAFLERLTNTICTAQSLFLDEVGALIDVHFAADDLAGQFGPLISPRVYRNVIKPRWVRIIETIKARTEAKVFYHSCGAVEEFIPDLIEIGVDALNTQIFCMNVEQLARDFKGKITFWGEICRQNILPFGTVDEVRAAVRRVRRAFDDGSGGLIAQCEWGIRDPKENIEAVFETWVE